jgi:hypothetical protein
MKDTGLVPERIFKHEWPECPLGWLEDGYY